VKRKPAARHDIKSRGKRLRARGQATSHRRTRQARRWSQTVSENSNALDLEPNTFGGSARQVAAALKRSAEHSRRRKSPPFRSAMSMLNFFVNRAGRNLSPDRRAVLTMAKGKLREMFGRLPNRPIRSKPTG